MNNQREQVFQFLDSHHISYQLYDHEPLFTVEQAEKIENDIPATHTKNLFLVDKTWAYHLVSIYAHDRLPIKDFARKFGLKDLSFAKPDKLMEVLRLTPGSVWIFGLLNYKSDYQSLTYWVEQKLWDAEQIGWHPNDNTWTVVLPHQIIEKIIETQWADLKVFSIDSLTHINNL